MAVRPIDANELYRIEKLLDTDIVRQDKVALNLLEQVLYDIQHVPTLTQPNELLTLEELQEMEDTTPVWWDQINSWVLVYKGNLTTWSGKHLYAKGCNGKFYRRPPEGVLCACDILQVERDACDEDFCFLICPLSKRPPEGDKKR